MLASTEWLEMHLRDPSLTILHVARDESAYRSGHVPGAHFVPWREVAVERDGLPEEVPTLDALVRLARELGLVASPPAADHHALAKAFLGIVGGHWEPRRRIVIYDDGLGLAAAQVYVALQYIGAAEGAALLDGQLRTWRAEGRPVSTASTESKRSEYVPKVHPEVFVSFDFVREVITGQSAPSETSIALVDVRPRLEFSGKEAGIGVKRAGHVPGALNLPWLEYLESEERPLLRSASDLSRRFREIGLRQEQLVVTYGRTGADAALAYFTLRYLGFDVRIYEGGFVEWSRSADAGLLIE
jgi:thiosulfate/3-mercaptopyruvate sulfurtransferase